MAPGCTIGGATASGGTEFGTPKSAAAPAFAVHNNQLYCLHRGSVANGNPKLYRTRFNGSGWTADTAFNAGVAGVQAPTSAPRARSWSVGAGARDCGRQVALGLPAWLEKSEPQTRANRAVRCAGEAGALRAVASRPVGREPAC